MARTTAAAADVVFVVGVPGMKGVHSLVRVVGELLEHDVPAERIVPVVNRAPKGGRFRAELTSAVASLLRGRPGAAHLPSPIFLPERRVDEALRDGVRLHASLTTPMVGAFHAIADGALGSRRPLAGGADEPRLLTPGSLGRWAESS